MTIFTLVITTGVALGFLQFDSLEKCQAASDKLAASTDSLMVSVCVEGALVQPTK